MKEKLVLIFWATIISIGLSAQPEAESSTVKIVERGPASPTTSSLGKYFDVPVNMATGIPNIQIPLYTIKTGNITLPISLNYHGGGVKVNTPASWVGLGWDLSCTNAITKQVNGLDDFYSTVQYPNSPSNPGLPAWSDYLHPDYTIDGNLGFTSMSAVIDSFQSGYAITHANDLNKLLGRIILSRYDGESDEYKYNTPEGGGSIFYNQKTSSFQLSELNGWKAEYSNDTWSLDNKNGINYGFTAKEEALSPIYNGELTTTYPDGYYTSAWYLTSIADVINNKSITLSYNVSGFGYTSGGTSRVENWDMIAGGPNFAGGNTRSYLRYGNELNLSTINFAEGRVEFIKDAAARIDGGVNALKTIKIYDKFNTLKKQFEFTYFYAWNSSSTTARLFLKSVQEINYISGAATENKPYLIHYDTTIAMPARFSYAQDLWGYYNGKTANNTNIPTINELVLMGIPTYADRNVDINYTQAGIIKQIVYPTGGSLNFTFENNKDNGDNLVGGLRIKQIKNFDSVANKAITTEYRYNDDNNHSTGTVQYRPTYHYFLDIGAQGQAYCRVSGESVFPLFTNQGSPVTYERVEKIEIGDNLELKSRHYFYNNLAGINMPGSPSYQNLIGVPFNKYPDLQKFSFLPYKTEIFRKDGSQYTLIQSESSGYQTLNQFQNYIWNAQAAWANGFGIFTEWAGHDPYSRNPIDPVPSVNAYKMFQESIVKNATTVETYSNNTVLRESVNKEFDPTNGNLRKSTSIASNGDTLRTYFYYTSDFQLTSSADPINQQINTFLNSNVKGQPIEMFSTRKQAGGGEYLVTASLYVYENNKPKKVLKIEGDGILFSAITKAYNNNNGFYYDSRYQTESEVLSYDAGGNPQEIKLRSKTQSIIWDTDDILATVENAGINDIAATSFETAATGKWTYSGTPIVDNTSPTAKKAYVLGNGNITKTSLDNTKTYIVSYWSKNGAQNVNGTSSTVGRSMNGWTYYEHTVANPSSGTITVSGTGTIDELRLYPKGKLMATFTYEPLIGMTTQCNANNMINYYEYDGFGRLTHIRDQDKNIVKKICYNYAGLPEVCAPVIYSSAAASGNFTRNNCGSEFVGSTVTYTVPAGTYTSTISQADADQKAQNDVNTNGQNYANANGTCTPLCNQVNCTGNDKKCINGLCETGTWVVISTQKINKTTWVCTYAYCFSDGTFSTYTQDVQSSTACAIGCL